MNVVYTDRHRSHDPKTFIHRGKLVESPERPSRAEILLAAARCHGHNTIETRQRPADTLTRIHTPRYLDFLEHGIKEWRKLSHAADEIVPNTHPDRFASHYANHIPARNLVKI